MNDQTIACHEPFAFGLGIARLFVTQTEAQWPELFDALRRTGLLAQVIGDITQLLDVPEHRDLAAEAFRCIGIYLAACRTRRADDGWLAPSTRRTMRAQIGNG